MVLASLVLGCGDQKQRKTWQDRVGLTPYTYRLVWQTVIVFKSFIVAHYINYTTMYVCKGVTQSNLENTWKIYETSGHALAYFKNDQLGRQWKPLGVMMMLLLSKVWQYMKSHQLNPIDMYVALMGSSQPSSINSSETANTSPKGPFMATVRANSSEFCWTVFCKFLEVGPLAGWHSSWLN